MILTIFIYIYLSNDENWTHIFDDWNLILYRSKEFNDTLKKLTYNYEIFTCLVGDADLSFEFKHYKNGTLSRHYKVDSPNYNDEIVTINYGKPFDIENEAFKFEELSDKVMFLAKLNWN